MNKGIHIHGTGFASFLFHYLAETDFGISISRDSKNLVIIPTGMSHITAQCLQKLTPTIFNEIANVIHINDTKNKAYKGSILNPKGIENIFERFTFNTSVREENHIYANDEGDICNKKTSEKFPYIFILGKGKKGKEMGCFESIFGGMPIYGFYVDEDYYIGWYERNNHDKLSKEKITSWYVQQFGEKIYLDSVRKFPVINEYSSSENSIYVGSGKGRTPIIVGIGNQLAIIDTLLSILYLVTNNKEYLVKLNTFRADVYNDIDTYLTGFEFFRSDEITPLWNKVDMFMLQVLKSYIITREKWNTLKN